ncbi:MAG: universal stress protein [Nocardioides sp.]|nr:universal stress protein [Nocardioides sp.]
MTSQMFSRILVAVDDSPAALAAVHVAVDLAASTGARLRFVHVIGDGELIGALASLGHDGEMAATRGSAAESLLRHVTAEAQRAGVPAEWDSLTGAPAAVLLGVARYWEADLVVIGRSDVRRAGRAYVGTVTRGVLEFSEVPVLVVPVPA